MSNLTIKEKVNKIEREIKFDKLSVDLNIKLLKGSKEAILFIADSITNRVNIKIDPIDLFSKDKTIIYHNELLFGILSSNSFLNIETTNVVSFCYDMDYYNFISVIEENCYNEKISHIELL